LNHKRSKNVEFWVLSVHTKRSAVCTLQFLTSVPYSLERKGFKIKRRGFNGQKGFLNVFCGSLNDTNKICQCLLIGNHLSASETDKKTLLRTCADFKSSIANLIISETEGSHILLSIFLWKHNQIKKRMPSVNTLDFLFIQWTHLQPCPISWDCPLKGQSHCLKKCVRLWLRMVEWV
jgi:hypothetical protein